jgi:hypothetical protein
MDDGPKDQASASANQGEPPKSRDTRQEEMPAPNHQTTPKDKNGWAGKDPPIFWVSVVGVIAVIAYTSVAAWQACLASRQLSIMQGQLVLMETDQRPWLKAQFEILKPLIFDAKGLQLALSGKTLNVGKLPAFNAELYPLIVTNVGDAAKTQRDFCENIRKSRKDRSGLIIFPGDHIINAPITRGFSPEEITRGKTMLRFDPPDFKRDLLGIVITGCVVYSLPGHKDSTPHMTGFGYLLRQSKGLGLNTDQGTIPLDEITYFILPELSWAD